jgi:Cd2+/Zn2+-exporting ATPase
MSRASTVTCTVCEIHAESTFRIDGMDCHEEVAILERRLKNLSGLESLSADVMGQRLLIKYDAARLNTNTITDAVADTGMRAWLEHEQPRVMATTLLRTRLLVLSGATLGAGLVLSSSSAPVLLVLALFLTSVVSAGVYPVRRAWAAICARHLDINVLMTVAVIGAGILGQWSEAATVVFLFALAQYLEARSMDRARHAIRALMDLAPQDALVVRPAGEIRVSVDDVAIGEIVRVRPGDKVPLDGVVVEGVGDVNQAPITGESLPAEKQPGDELFAGSINGHGAFQMRVTRFRRDTTLARIIHLVEEAQSQRAPSQAFVERFARIYTPAVLVLAVLVAIVPPLAAGYSFSDWIYRALVLLVIACPCALVISTPVSIVSALAAAARRGVLIKGGLHLERAASLRCIAFDKTGTLTMGRPTVADVRPVQGRSPGEVLAVAASLARSSEHPLATAIAAYADERNTPTRRSTDYRALPGRGGEAFVDGVPAVSGNARLFEERRLLTDQAVTDIANFAGEGQTSVLVAQDGQLLGIVALSDAPRPLARDVVALVRQHGIEHVAMLTGDNDGAGRAIAAALGIDDVRAELLPAAKVDAVRDLKTRYGATGMVGDGVNDAPALAAADVGIVMGAAGSDAALETADIALMGDDLTKIPFTLRLSRRALRNIKTNVTLSIGLKAVFLALAIGGYATLWMAIAADTGASLLVVANGLRLLRTT